MPLKKGKTRRNKKKNVKESFDRVYVKLMGHFLLEGNPAMPPTNSGMSGIQQSNNANPNVGMPSGATAVGVGKTFQTEKPNNSKPNPSERIDPELIEALNKAHVKNNPDQTIKNIDAVMSQSNVQNIDTTSRDWANLHPEIQQALVDRNPQEIQNNIIKKNNAINGVNTPIKKTQPTSYTNNYMPQQNSGSIPQSQNTTAGQG